MFLAFILNFKLFCRREEMRTMDAQQDALNRFLVEVFNEILKAEEASVTKNFRGLSLKELHVIEAVCRAEREGLDDRCAAIAAAQRVTPGTLTTAVALLEKKGYLLRRRDDQDRRVVRIRPTDKGRRADERHAAFHQQMVEHILAALSPEQAAVFMDALGAVAEFFHQTREAATDAPPQAEKETVPQ